MGTKNFIHKFFGDSTEAQSLYVPFGPNRPPVWKEINRKMEGKFMKKVKKLLALLLSAAMLLSLAAGCSGPAPENSAPAPQSPASDGQSGQEGEAAQTSWPEKSVTVIVPYNPGGDSDFNARALCERLTAVSGQSFVVTNVNGNSGAVGSLQALSSEPDGYTILFNHLTFAVNYFTGNSTLTYDDAEMGGIVGYRDDGILVARSALGISKLSEVITYSQEHGGMLYGASAGSLVMMAGYELRDRGANITIVDAGGAADRLASLLGGHVDFIYVSASDVADYVTTGELTILENDLGTPVTLPTYYQMLFPKGTDQAIINKFAALCQEAIFEDKAYADTIMTAYNQEPYYKEPQEATKILSEVWDQLAGYTWQ